MEVIKNVLKDYWERPTMFFADLVGIVSLCFIFYVFLLFAHTFGGV